ncbi:hydroxylase [Minicystis rosea]|nr:hydroxylase [Minicystis rosea]
MNQTRALSEQYDFVIVGGRPAGASLAARLGARGIKVLVIDRADFPSAPGVPSCPVIYPSAMRLLDEMGIEERLYAKNAVPIRDIAIEFGSHFTAPFRMLEAFGRDYIYSIDRVSFDRVLWDNLARFPSVTRRARFSFVDLVRDESGRVIGIDGHDEGGPTVRIHARCVIGADGRFSMVARKAGARITEDHPDCTSTVYFAEWEGVRDLPGGGASGILVHTTGRGLNVMLISAPGGRTTVCTQERSDHVDVHGHADTYYQETLERLPALRRRLEGAKQVTPLRGLKRIANRYYEFGGPGWVLVGDAVHQKDPVDGQGIYDALLETQILDEALAAWHEGKVSFEQALASYRERVLAGTHGMFMATMDRLRRELYDEPPEVVIRTMLRWALHDPEYQRQFLLFLSRAIPPESWNPSSLLPAVSMRGVLADIKRWLARDSAPVSRPPRARVATG